jgi:lysophospholipase L1-like esterase
MNNRLTRTKRPLHLVSFCLLVMPFFLLAALAAIFLPGPVREAESSTTHSSATGLPVGQMHAPPAPILLSPAHLSSGPDWEDNSITSEVKNEPSEPWADPLPAAEPPTAVAYDFSKPVPSMDIALTEEYFQDVIFIGDSRTEGFQLYSGPQNSTYYHSKGLKVDTIFSSQVVKTSDGTITIMEAMRQKPLTKVYIMLGINELGWAYSDLFIEKYTEIITAIRKIEPEVQIYVQSILPVSEKRSQSDKTYNNANIGRYNELIQQMAAEERLYYLNVAECVADGEGNLCSDASTDGIHLNKTYCDLWLDYLKYHAALPQQE